MVNSTSCRSGFRLVCYLEDRSLLFTDEHTNVWVTQVGAVDLLVPASRVDVCEGLIDLQSPHTFVMETIGGDTPLLTQRPQTDGPI